VLLAVTMWAAATSDDGSAGCDHSAVVKVLSGPEGQDGREIKRAAWEAARGFIGC
jgi:hypothetical protein